MKVLCVIILFNRKLQEAAAFSTLVKGVLSDGIQLYVYDNSPSPEHSEHDFRHNPFIHYVSDVTNPGVSAGYNRASDFALRNGFTYLLLLDQDSTFDSCDYIQACIEKAGKLPHIKLFVPQVVTTSGCRMSPVRLRLKIPTRFVFQAGREYPMKSAGIINSGMFVEVNAMKKAGGYNEKVFLDYSDYQFVDRLSVLYKSFYLIDRKLIQDFSNEETDSDKLFVRYKLFCKSLKAYKSDSFAGRLAIVVILLKRTLSLTLRCRSAKFLKHYLFPKS